MTTGSAELTELEAQRAELETLLSSREFTRAPKLAQLLSYLCERLFAGEANQIKEYSIGLEVFHRGASFDQDSDSIVRVEANRLRRRLAEYYAGEGASHSLRITIPVGQYVPRFEPVIPQPPVEARRHHHRGTPTGHFSIVPLAELAPPSWPPAMVDVSPSWSSCSSPSASDTPGCSSTCNRLQPPSRPSPANPLQRRQTCSLVRPTAKRSGSLPAALEASSITQESCGAPISGSLAAPPSKAPCNTSGAHRIPTSTAPAGQGDFRYDIPLKKGIYELRLHFAETVYGPESTGSGGEGNRIMTVRANGKTLLNGFDVVADAGASRTADVKVFPEISPAADGILHLEFAGENGKQATLSAIEILPGVRGHIRPVRILARQTPYYSNDSRWWSPDNYFEGGEIAAYPTPVSGTDDPELYETERWGNFSYSIPVSPGKYTVTLHFAVRHGNWDRGPAEGGDNTSVPHIFNVFCNGQAILQAFDPVKEAGESDVVVRKFVGLQPNAQGKILLSFVPVEGYATVTGIEVLPL